ncbi:alpha-L-rhamnosidase N-terminal domain-containing protein [Diplocloster hominis]|uniref:alpha-L-rhamnosidase N-terminal domain-containing protein n=1 Tax=Diplocloster hominis TaxID=3079010 RepID=UPI0031BB96C0
MNKLQIPHECKEDTVLENGMILSRAAQDFSLPERQRMWTAKWIWVSEKTWPKYQNCQPTAFCKGTDTFGVFLFQKRWKCERIPDEAVLYITADTAYKVYINGMAVGRGSAQLGGDYGNCESAPYKCYEAYRVESFIQEGENTITVRVHLGVLAAADISCGYGGLLAELVCGSGRIPAVATDDSWKCSRDLSYPDQGEWNGANPPEETEEGYRDETWENAVILESGFFPELYAAPIPHLSYHRISPTGILNPFDFQDRVRYSDDFSSITVKKGAPICLWLDFGCIYPAYYVLRLKGARGVKIVLHMQEFPGKAGQLYPGKVGGKDTEILTLGDGEACIESLALYSVRYIQISISNLWQDLEICEAGINACVYPTRVRGDFVCSDPLFEQIYKSGMRTLHICRNTYHMDSPVHQEPMGCMADYRIHGLINYYTFADPYLLRFDIQKIAGYLKSREYRMFHPSFCLIFVSMIREYVMHTGDFEMLYITEDAVAGILDLFASYLGENGLIENAPNYMFMDWVEEDRWTRHHPPKCMGQGYMSALFTGALTDAAAMLELMEQENTARQEIPAVPLKRYERIRSYRILSERVSEGIRRNLWDEERGLFLDGRYDPLSMQDTEWMPADVDRKFYSQHMNALTVLYHIVPEEKQRELMLRVLEDPSLSQAQPYFMHFVLEALGEAGMFEEYGLGQIRRWKDLLDENPDSLKEVWYGFDCDYSHAFSGIPTYQLPSKILGVTPAAPGFDEIWFSPCLPKELSFAFGCIPTPRGDIRVNLYREGNELKTKLDLPAGVKVRKA